MGTIHDNSSDIYEQGSGGGGGSSGAYYPSTVPIVFATNNSSSSFLYPAGRVHCTYCEPAQSGVVTEMIKL